MKKTKVIEIGHKVAPTPAVVNPLQSQISDLKEAVAGQEALRQKGYIELRRQIEELRIDRDYSRAEYRREIATIYDIFTNGEIRSRWVFGGNHD